MVNHKSVMVLSDGNSYPSSSLKEIAIGGKKQLPLEKFKGERISGRNRYETALAIAKRSFNDNENVVLASGQVFADSLSAVSLTKKHNAPIILTEFENLTKNTKEYLNKRESIYIVGGFKTIDKDILANITSEEKYERNKERIKDQIKSLEEEAKQFEETSKPKIEEANKKISEVDALLSKTDERIKEGAFAFFPWVVENYPEYKEDVDKGLAILNDFYEKGDVKKTPEDATSYENMVMTADWLEQLNGLRLKDEHFTGLKKLDTNFEILAKAMVSCDRSLDYTKGHRHTFSVWENLYWGATNPFKGWYDDEKLVYEELMNTINTKYSAENKDVALEKAKADFMIKYNGEKPVIGHYTNILSDSINVVAVTKNSSQNGYFRNTFCMNGDFGHGYKTFISEEKYREIINAYAKINDKKYLLEEKASAQKTIKDIENEKNSRKQKIQNLKKGNTEKIIKIK